MDMITSMSSLSLSLVLLFFSSSVFNILHTDQRSPAHQLSPSHVTNPIEPSSHVALDLNSGLVYLFRLGQSPVVMVKR
jgi:hypothetical protein